MSVQASSWVWERSAQSGSALLALLAIANHANSEGKNAFPSIQTLADECRMSRRGMKYILAKIPSSELKVRKDSGPRGCNTYELPGVVRDGFHIPGRRRGANFAPSNDSAVGQTDAAVGQDTTILGAIAVSPEPSLTVEPSMGKNPAAKPAPLRRQKPAPGDSRFQPFFAFAFESFTVKHRRKPLWQAKDRSGLKNLLNNHNAESLSLRRLQTNWRNFLDSTEPFTVNQGGSFAYFCSHVDKFSGGPILAASGKGGVNGKCKDTNEAVATTMHGAAINAGITD